MRWEDERYVRLYTRDTVDWEMMPWQARALFPLLLRKVDRAGILHLGKHGAVGLANVVRLPIEVTEPGLAGLVADGSVELHGDSLVVRNFIEAQEATASDAKRARDYRERHRNSVTNRDAPVTQSDTDVTTHHGPSRDVTEHHSVPIRAVPSRAVPDPLLVADAPSPKGKTKKAAQSKSERTRWAEVIAAYSDDWKALHSANGQGPALDGADRSALVRLYDRFGPDETIALLKRFVSDPDPFIAKRGHMLRDLESRLNAYRAKPVEAPRVNGQLPLSSSVTDETRARRKF